MVMHADHLVSTIFHRLGEQVVHIDDETLSVKSDHRHIRGDGREDVRSCERAIRMLCHSDYSHLIISNYIRTLFL